MIIRACARPFLTHHDGLVDWHFRKALKPAMAGNAIGRAVAGPATFD
jgi:hypothetical protein